MNDPNTIDNEIEDCAIRLDVDPLPPGTPEDQARAEEAQRKYEARLAEEARSAEDARLAAQAQEVK